MKILIIGKNSYIGNHIDDWLTSKGHQVAQLDVLTDEWRTFDYSPYDAIVHVAGIVHRPDCQDWELYKRVNTDMPITIATMAKEQGVKQYVFFSTMGVYGIRRHELEDLIKEEKLEGQVKLLGLRTDVPNILKTADVVIMSSHWEGLSLSNIEGMAAGKPFVASDVKGLREVTKGYGILFPHGDAKVLAEVISRLHDDKQYYYQISERCYERAKEFDISKMVEAYNQVYESFYNERK